MTREQKMEQTCHCEHLPPLYTCLDTDGTQPPAGNSNHYVPRVQGRLITALLHYHYAIFLKKTDVCFSFHAALSLLALLQYFTHLREMTARIKVKHNDYN